MRSFMDITRALSDKNRVRALMALRGRELCVCQIIELLSLAPSTVSKHMQILRQARLVECRKDGRWIYYSLANDKAPPAARAAIEWICNTVAKDPKIRDDVKHLNQILKMDPETVCRLQQKS
ncbi:MAG: metalloregulator ArsR/SmtB family transcription factor [bacterium]